MSPKLTVAEQMALDETIDTNISEGLHPEEQSDEDKLEDEIISADY